MPDIDPKFLSALSDPGDEQGYLKAGTLGFPKSGKSMTAALLACAVVKHFNLTGQIAMFDTEGGSIYLKPIIKTLTGRDLLSKRARSFEDMMRWGQSCVEAGVSVAIADSVTHPWRELCDSYLAQLNEYLASKRYSLKTRLSFEDWAVLKPRWQKWTDFYLNAPIHLIIAGRAGWEYEFVTNEKGKKELQKTGTKMKTEGEFGFEPSLLFELEPEEFNNSKGEQELGRKCTVLGDRFSVIDGASTIFRSFNANDPAQLQAGFEAVYKFFRPHLDRLKPGSHSTVDTNRQTPFEVSGGDDEWTFERKARTILCEEIQGELVEAYPSQSAADKKAKGELILEFFGTRSWTKVESTDSGKLRSGLKALREKLAERKREELALVDGAQEVVA